MLDLISFPWKPVAILIARHREVAHQHPDVVTDVSFRKIPLVTVVEIKTKVLIAHAHILIKQSQL